MTKRIAASATDTRLCILRSPVRWNWILAVALGTLLGLLLATWLGETGATLGGIDPLDTDVTLTSHPPR